MKPDILTLQDVTNELKWEPDLSSGEISVKVHDGIVTLGAKCQALEIKRLQKTSLGVSSAFAQSRMRSK